MKTTDISTAVFNPIRDNCIISRFGASHGCFAFGFGASHGFSAVRIAIGHRGSKPGCAIPAKKPGLAPKRLICAASPNGGEEIAHRSPEAIMDEIAALDAESAEVLSNIKQALSLSNGAML